MPEHLHFVIWLLDGSDRRGGHLAAQGAQQRAPTLGSVVGAFKTMATRSINAHRGTTGQQVWQRNYFEHIIRTEDELRRIREYIQHNPLESHHHVTDDLSEAWEADEVGGGHPAAQGAQQRAPTLPARRAAPAH